MSNAEDFHKRLIKTGYEAAKHDIDELKKRMLNIENTDFARRVIYDGEYRKVVARYFWRPHFVSYETKTGVSIQW